MKGFVSALSASVLAGALLGSPLDAPPGELLVGISPSCSSEFVALTLFRMAEFKFVCEPARSPRDGREVVPENCGAGSAACICGPSRTGTEQVAPGSISARSGAGAGPPHPDRLRHGWPGVLARNQHFSPKSHLPVVVQLVQVFLSLSPFPLPFFPLPPPSAGAAV